MYYCTFSQFLTNFTNHKIGPKWAIAAWKSYSHQTGVYSTKFGDCGQQNKVPGFGFRRLKSDFWCLTAQYWPVLHKQASKISIRISTSFSVLFATCLVFFKKSLSATDRCRLSWSHRGQHGGSLLRQRPSISQSRHQLATSGPSPLDCWSRWYSCCRWSGRHTREQSWFL